MNVIEQCKPWIEAALAYSGGTHTFEDIVDGIAEGRFQLWPSERGCLVTEIVVYPRKKILNVFLGGGELAQLADMHRDVIEWAKAQGCQAASITGRKGWERAFRQYGWTPRHVTLGLEFD
jgi:hypothetical protein